MDERLSQLATEIDEQQHEFEWADFWANRLLNAARRAPDYLLFMLAIGTRRATPAGAFWGLLAGMAVVAIVAFHPATRSISYLWHNLIGAAVVPIVGLTISLFTRPAPVR